MQKETGLLGTASDIQKKLQSERSTSAQQLDKLSQQLERLRRSCQQKAASQQSGQYAQEEKAVPRLPIS